MPRRRLVVEADGGSRGNPGVAGYGALVRDEHGAVLAERAAPLGRASNNVAEYTALVEGLRAVLDLGLAEDADVEVRMDSKLVVEQMSGRWKIKHEDMRRLAVRARDLALQIQQLGGLVRYTWVPRERNTAADALSNAGMDGLTVVRDHIESAAPEQGPPEAQPDADADADVDATAHVGADGAGQAATGPDARQPPEPTFGEVRTPVTELLISAETTPTLDGSCRLVLVRHGVTAYTEAHRLDGRGGSDPELSPKGHAQARAAAGAVRALVDRSPPTPVAVVTSSLLRARQTGAAVADALGVEPEVDPDWDEQGFGDWDGWSIQDLVAACGQDLLRLRKEPDYARPGGESHAELVARVTDAFGRAVGRGGTVVVASHRIPLMCVLAQVLGIDADRVWSLATAPASLTAIEVWPDGGVQVAFVNDTHHLHHLD